ncbi:Uncharacterized protein HZ326_18173 [Fusarium oxysporum f. sp. albedinis]|nr:Uncharacterized protein HZ326_18173 [Fusarium oxysporum f. sp. albedinis]
MCPHLAMLLRRTGMFLGTFSQPSSVRGFLVEEEIEKASAENTSCHIDGGQLGYSMMSEVSVFNRRVRVTVRSRVHIKHDMENA